MNTLVIYDSTGTAFSGMITGSYTLPQGPLYFAEVDIPADKMFSKMDTTVTPHVPIFIDAPVSETKVLEDRVAFLEGAFNEMIGL